MLGRKSSNGSSATTGAKRSRTSSGRRPELADEIWYHGLLPREDINKLLVHEGDYLVRTTEPQAGQGKKVVLSVMWTKRAHHFVINERAGKFAIEKFQFDSVGDLIRYHSRKKIPVTARSGAKLLNPIERQDWELRHEQIELGKRLGEGAFGGVFAGKLRWTDKGETRTTDVAVKVHKGGAMTKQLIKEICKEARLMRNYAHPNVVRFYGVAAETEPLMLVMELVNGGSLDTYLQKRGATVTPVQRISMCLDAARGLQYLHDNNCIHRDVAARNCLVDDNRVKISDFGLSTEDTNYKLKDLKTKLPIRWLAPETLSTAAYSKMTDVFSFGVLVWEVYMNGAEPYPGMTVAEVQQRVKGGYRMLPPPTIPAPMRALMEERCWHADPHKRWTFTQIVDSMASLYGSKC